MVRATDSHEQLEAARAATATVDSEVGLVEGTEEELVADWAAATVAGLVADLAEDLAEDLEADSAVDLAAE